MLQVSVNYIGNSFMISLQAVGGDPLARSLHRRGSMTVDLCVNVSITFKSFYFRRQNVDCIVSKRFKIPIILYGWNAVINGVLAI